MVLKRLKTVMDPVAEVAINKGGQRGFEKFEGLMAHKVGPAVLTWNEDKKKVERLAHMVALMRNEMTALQDTLAKEGFNRPEDGSDMNDLDQVGSRCCYQPALALNV